MIKRVILIQRNRYITRTFFTKYIAENGGAVCTVDGEIVTPSEGNDIYRKLKAEGAVREEVTFTDMNDREIIEHIESGIDRYTMYIENYNQQLEAERNNDRLRGIASAFKEAAKA